MELSKRMKNNACLVDQGSMAADIGCDQVMSLSSLYRKENVKKSLPWI